MDRQLELELIERCLQGFETKTTTSGPQGRSDAHRYCCSERFELEMDRVIRRLPFPVVHSSDIRDTNAFRRVDTQLGQLVTTRDETGQSHLFFNSCRHRGTTLVTEDFELGEGIQRSLASGAIKDIHYGCNEWSLKAFNDNLDRLCGLAPV